MQIVWQTVQTRSGYTSGQTYLGLLSLQGPMALSFQRFPWDFANVNEWKIIFASSIVLRLSLM